jgi:sulfinoalanine decarboxylase/sulfinoalanine decarboxylase/aspartate 1-decarboxylase
MYKGIPARDICTLLYEHSELLVGYGSFKDDEFIRLITINAQNDHQDILNFFKTMEQFVADNAALFEEQVSTKNN